MIAISTIFAVSILLMNYFCPVMAQSLVPGIHGMSTVEKVWFTWVILSSENEISVNLRYSGANTGTTPAVNITATALINNNLDQSTASSAMIGSQYLKAGWISPSSLTIKMKGTSSLYDAPIVTVVASPSEQSPLVGSAQNTDQSTPPENIKSEALNVLSTNSFIDSIGYLHVVGEVENNTPNVAKFVKVTGTFYNKGNEVVATDFTYTSPTDLGPGDKAPFEIILTSASIPINQIDHHSIIVSHD